MGNKWNELWTTHSELFLANNWEELPEEKRKTWRLSPKFHYFVGGEALLRAGIVACSSQQKEEEFLLAGITLGMRFSNGVKTVIYFVAPDFSPFFLDALGKIEGVLTLKAMYYREKLTPSLYPIPEQHRVGRRQVKYSLGIRRPNWTTWEQGLNPVAVQQLNVVRQYFEGLKNGKLDIEIKPQNIIIKWGTYEVAEIKKKGKKFELSTKLKWAKDPEKVKNWQKSGWVDASANLNEEFTKAVEEILNYLDEKETKGELPQRERLHLWLSRGTGVISTLWGKPWKWPWMPKERQETWVSELENCYYYEADGQISVVYPIIDRAPHHLVNAVIFSSVLEMTNLLTDTGYRWDGRIHLLTLATVEEELRNLHGWLKYPQQFPIWVLPQDWSGNDLQELRCKTLTAEDDPVFPYL